METCAVHTDSNETYINDEKTNTTQQSGKKMHVHILLYVSQ